MTAIVTATATATLVSPETPPTLMAVARFISRYLKWPINDQPPNSDAETKNEGPSQEEASHYTPGSCRPQ